MKPAMKSDSRSAGNIVPNGFVWIPIFYLRKIYWHYEKLRITTEHHPAHVFENVFLFYEENVLSYIDEIFTSYRIDYFYFKEENVLQNK